jgi:ubiquinone/menaquinone biosynthesis C-methylase UbiE
VNKRRPEESEADRWFRRHAEDFLRRIGVRECLQVADIGCHHGRYTIPIARIVGSCGTVYAVDRNRDALSRVKKAVGKGRRRNVKLIKADLSRGTLKSIKRRSVDVALLYDVLHRGYMPGKRERRNMLRNVYRIVKPGGSISCYPTHLRKYGLTFAKLVKEITDAGFVLKGEARRRLIHDGKLVRGRVFNFVKRAS